MTPSGELRRPRLPRLHVVTDDGVLARDDFGEAAAAVLAAGGPDLALHLRGPRTCGRRLHELALVTRARAGESGALVLANDRVDVARAADLDGVQLGARSLPAAEARDLLPPGAWVGVSVHDGDAAARAASEGADFLLVGTIFATPSHPGRPGAGPGLLSGVGRRTRLPLVAIGGITPGRVHPVLEAGAAGVAVLRGVWDAQDPVAAVDAYLAVLGRVGGGPPADRDGDDDERMGQRRAAEEQT